MTDTVEDTINKLEGIMRAHKLVTLADLVEFFMGEAKAVERRTGTLYYVLGLAEEYPGTPIDMSDDLYEITVTRRDR